jgi:aspartyl/asparaginyl-tRNA synthetase
MENIPEPILAVQLKKQIINIINDYREWLLTNTNNEYNKDEKICGWVRDFRLQSENAFISLHDGSTADILTHLKMSGVLVLKFPEQLLNHQLKVN